jgi:hypothetical protein
LEALKKLTRISKPKKLIVTHGWLHAGRMTNCCLVLSLTIMTVLGIIAGLHVYRVFVVRK